MQRNSRSFLPFADYYCRCIKCFVDISFSLQAGSSVKVSFHWKSKIQKSICLLIEKPTTLPVLETPDFKAPFRVETDASERAVGAFVVRKKKDGKTYPIYFASKILNYAENKYPSSEREDLTVTFAVKTFRLHLHSSQLSELLTDRQTLYYAFQKKDIAGHLALRINSPAEYYFKIVFRSEANNCTVHFLSRIIIPATQKFVDGLKKLLVLANREA